MLDYLAGRSGPPAVQTLSQAHMLATDILVKQEFGSTVTNTTILNSVRNPFPKGSVDSSSKLEGSLRGTLVSLQKLSVRRRMHAKIFCLAFSTGVLSVRTEVPLHLRKYFVKVGYGCSVPKLKLSLSACRWLVKQAKTCGPSVVMTIWGALSVTALARKLPDSLISLFKIAVSYQRLRPSQMKYVKVTGVISNLLINSTPMRLLPSPKRIEEAKDLTSIGIAAASIYMDTLRRRTEQYSRLSRRSSDRTQS